MEAWDIFDRIMVHEGGGKVHEVPGDRGGLTKWGVSQRANPGIDVAALTKEEAFKIFMDRYFFPSRSDKVPGVLKYLQADAAYNHGPTQAIRLLQRASDGRLKEDGIYGPKTHARVFSAEVPLLAKAMLYVRMDYFARIVANDPSQAKFLRGWANRLRNINAEIFS